jgi:cohesin loading factor subunit SCC2
MKQSGWHRFSLVHFLQSIYNRQQMFFSCSKTNFRCTAKSEEDYRRLFELFLQDLLTLLYRPEWPVAELLLTMLANNLVKNIIEKTNDISLRVASLDYLGTITARLRRDRVTASTEASSNLEQNRLDLVVKSILNDESTNASNNTDDIDISHV